MSKQVFRLMDLPDKILAFDELPSRFLTGLEMVKADGFPKHWKDWMGKQTKIMRIPPEKNPLTGEVITYKPIEEEDYFFYVVDWNIRSQEDKWKEIMAYVRLHAPQDMRIPENLADMGKPLAEDKLSAISLEPEDVTVIPIPLEEKGKAIEEPLSDKKIVKCDEPGCTSEFEGSYAKNALRMHKQRKHPAPVVAKV